MASICVTEKLLSEVELLKKKKRCKGLEETGGMSLRTDSAH